MMLSHQAQVASAQSSLDAAQKAVDLAQLTSPVDGLVASVGIVAGTYSSIYVAAPLVLWWYGGKRPKTA